MNWIIKGILSFAGHMALLIVLVFIGSFLFVPAILFLAVSGVVLILVGAARGL